MSDPTTPPASGQPSTPSAPPVTPLLVVGRSTLAAVLGNLFHHQIKSGPTNLVYAALGACIIDEGTNIAALCDQVLSQWSGSRNEDVAVWVGTQIRAVVRFRQDGSSGVVML